MTPEQAASRVQRFGKSHPGALRLVRLLSFAAIAEPGFIRTMRMQFVPGSSAGDEADVGSATWCSPDRPAVLCYFLRWPTFYAVVCLRR